METPKNSLRRSSLLAAVAAVSFFGCASAQKSQIEPSLSPANLVAARQLTDADESTEPIKPTEKKEYAEYFQLLAALESQMSQFKANIIEASSLLVGIDVDITSRKIDKLVSDVLELTKANAGSGGELMEDHPDAICPVYSREDSVGRPFEEVAAALDEAEGDLDLLKRMKGHKVVPPPKKAEAFEAFRETTVAEFIAEGERGIADLRKDLEDKSVDAGLVLLPSKTGMVSGLNNWNREDCGEAE